MDQAPDTAYNRFRSAWIGFLIIAAFLLAALVFGLFNRGETTRTADAASERRLTLRNEVRAAQATALETAKLSEKKEAQIKALLASKPAPGEMKLPSAEPSPNVPTPSETDTASGLGQPLVSDSTESTTETSAEKPEMSATPETPAEEAPDPEAPAADPATLTLGKELYSKPGSCVTCHQATGLGLANVFPPLVNSEWVTGPTENLIRIQLRGLMGEITVAGLKYNSVMPPIAVYPQTAENTAAVLTYVRHEFGNGASPITPEMVAKFEGEKGKPTLTAADLIDPNEGVETPAEDSNPPTE